MKQPEGNTYDAWAPLLTLLSCDDASQHSHINLTSKERGMINALLSSPPATLSFSQCATLQSLYQQWHHYEGSLQ